MIPILKRTLGMLGHVVVIPLIDDKDVDSPRFPIADPVCFAMVA